MTIPQVTGDEMAQKPMSIRPDMLVIPCTGFCERITEENVRVVGIKAFISEAGTNVRDSQDYPRLLDQEIEVF